MLKKDFFTITAGFLMFSVMAMSSPSFGSSRVPVAGHAPALQLKAANLSFVPARTFVSTLSKDQRLSDACTLTFADVSSSVFLGQDKKKGYYTTVEFVGDRMELHFYIIESGVFSSATLACVGPHRTQQQVAKFTKGIGTLYIKKP